MMGLFDLFKKKSKITVTFQAPISSPPEWLTWKKTHGNTDNDYANAVFLNLHKEKWRKPHTLSDTESLSHKLQKLGITNPIRKHSDMLHAGYFCEATPAEVLNTYRIKEIQEILEKYRITPIGKKADLIGEILRSIPIKKLKLPTMYFISDKGMEYIKAHEDLIKLFGNPYNITYEEYMAAKADAPSYLKYNDIVWRVFNCREMSFGVEDDFLRRYNAYYRAEFLHSEGQDATALREYIRVIYYDVNEGLKNYRYISSVKRRASKDRISHTELIKRSTSLGDFFAEKVLSLKTYYSSDMVERCVSCTDVATKYISDSDFLCFVDNLFTNGETSFLKYAQ